MSSIENSYLTVMHISEKRNFKTKFMTVYASINLNYTIQVFKYNVDN